jgi:hypothetical protein
LLEFSKFFLYLVIGVDLPALGAFVGLFGKPVIDQIIGKVDRLKYHREGVDLPEGFALACFAKKEIPDHVHYSPSAEINFLFTSCGGY